MTDIVATREKPTLGKTYQEYVYSGDIKDIFYHWHGFNEWLFSAIYGIRGETYDRVMLLISQLSSRHNFFYYLGGMIVIMLLGAAWRKILHKGGLRHHFSVWLAIILLFASGYVVAGGAVSALKISFEMPRPYVAMEAVEGLNKKANTEDDYRSFPSGHTAFMSIVVLSMWPVLTSGIMQLLGALAIVAVAWSRVSLGMHFPADTLWAFLITWPIMMVLRSLIFNVLRRMRFSV